MPRGVYDRGRSKVLVTSPSSEVTSLLPATAFTELKWWSKLPDNESKIVLEEGRALAQAMLTHVESGLSIGEHLSKVQAILEPHSLFGRFLSNFSFSRAQAYRYISQYKNAKGALPETILKAAVVRGLDIVGVSEARPLGNYTEAYKKLPPSEEATKNLDAAVTYVEQLKNVQKTTTPSNGNEQITVTPVTVDLAVKIAFRTLRNLAKRLPTDRRGQNRMKFFSAVAGMMLTEFGVANPLSVSPVAIPGDIQAGRGRPRLAVA